MSNKTRVQVIQSIRRGNAPVSQFADPDYRGRPIRIVRVKNVQVGNYIIV